MYTVTVQLPFVPAFTALPIYRFTTTATTLLNFNHVTIPGSVCAVDSGGQNTVIKLLATWSPHLGSRSLGLPRSE
jgi:hypothetical protein